MNTKNLGSIKDSMTNLLDEMAELIEGLDLYEDDFKNKMSDKSREKATSVCSRIMLDYHNDIENLYKRVQGLGKKIMNIVDDYLD